VHRGPDGCGVWISSDGRIGLGHRRLSIIDLSPMATQPMSNADQTLWVTFNGEIYNHADIRKELNQLGHFHWRTDHSDTEVILYAFQQWGIDCIHKFRGMFAFALWDVKKQELYLVRDRIGIKPLYFSVHGHKVAFASEIKALLKDASQPRAVNEEAFYHYLSFLTTPSPHTLFKGIKKLPGGTWIKFNRSGHYEERRYWDVWDHVQPRHNMSDQAIADELLSTLKEAVALRKVSDVPMGVFLSGGVDSSTNAALFSYGEAEPINTFSIGYEGDYPSYPSELPFARFMAKEIGANYHEKLLTQDDLLNFLPRMIHLQDEPIADPVCVPVYYVSKLAKDNGVTVVQVGEGADELFCGYPSWKVKLNLQRYGRLPVPRFLKRYGLKVLKKKGWQGTPEYEALRRSSMGLPIFWGGSESFSEDEKHLLLPPRLLSQFENYSSWEAIKPIRQRFLDKAWEPSILNWMSYLDLNYRLPELLLMRVDKMSMGVSVEGRVPFLDHKLVELALSIPTQVKMRNGELKGILKKAVRGVIPDKIIDRKKQGFGVPVYEWFVDRLGHYAREELENFCKETDLLQIHYIRDLMERKQGPQVWYLLNFVLWWKAYIKQPVEDVITV